MARGRINSVFGGAEGVGVGVKCVCGRFFYEKGGGHPCGVSAGCGVIFSMHPSRRRLRSSNRGYQHQLRSERDR